VYTFNSFTTATADLFILLKLFCTKVSDVSVTTNTLPFTLEAFRKLTAY